MGAQQPFMYQPVENQNERLPYKAFDPKAVTRASMQPRPQKKKKQEGPLISFNRHPEYVYSFGLASHYTNWLQQFLSDHADRNERTTSEPVDEESYHADADSCVGLSGLSIAGRTWGLYHYDPPYWSRHKYGMGYENNSETRRSLFPKCIYFIAVTDPL